MHLKGYVVDHERVRTGFANFSPGGLKQQNNDLVLIQEPEAAKAFEANFARMWAIAVAHPGCAIKGNITRSGDHI